MLAACAIAPVVRQRNCSAGVGVSRLSTCRTGAAMIVSFVRRAQRDSLPRMRHAKGGAHGLRGG